MGNKASVQQQKTYSYIKILKVLQLRPNNLQKPNAMIGFPVVKLRTTLIFYMSENITNFFVIWQFSNLKYYDGHLFNRFAFFQLPYLWNFMQKLNFNNSSFLLIFEFLRRNWKIFYDILSWKVSKINFSRFFFTKSWTDKKFKRYDFRTKNGRFGIMYHTNPKM